MNDESSAPTRKSRLATASLAFGICSLVPCLGILTFIPAIVLGIVALVKISKSQGQIGGRCQAIAGLIMGCVSIILAAMLQLALDRGPEKARRSICLNNEKMLADACLMYARDNDGVLPRSFDEVKGYWLSKYGFNLSPKQFTCPSVRNPSVQSYQIVGGGRKLADIKDPDTPLIVENPSDHYGSGSNVAYVDGHVEWVPAQARAPSH
jgi:prepilin-type processing-associated H-X9-DG protein